MPVPGSGITNEPLDDRESTEPMNGGGSSFRTHRLVQVNPLRIEFRSTIQNILFCLLFILIGAGVAVGFPYGAIQSGEPLLETKIIVPAVIGLVFFTLGWVMLFHSQRPLIFDLRRGIFSKCRKNVDLPAASTERSSSGEWVSLRQVRALQIISEHCRGSDSSFYSYELNLVCDDGHRVNVVDHGDLKQLRRDAGRLAAILGKPLRDHT